MGVEQGLLALVGAADFGGAYQIEQSLRFNQADSTYLNWTPSTAGSVKKWTWSGWVKRGKGGIFGQGGDYHPASIVANNGSTYNLPVYFGYNTEADQSLFYYGNTPLQSKTSQVFRDFSGWYHFVAFIDTDQATAANRQKLYVNGVEVTSWATQNLPSQGDSAGVINTTSVHRIGWTGSPSQQYFDGYMAECHFIDGQALDPENFGEFDDNGVWRPIAYTGSYGTNGFYLKFDPSATNGIGHDHSGNGNNWTPNNFTTSGAYTDVMDDTPTNNFATLNPLTGFRPGGATGRTYSDGNLVEYTPNQSGKEHPLITTTQFVRSADGGVYQWEDTVTNSNAWITFNPWLETENAYGSGNAAFFSFYSYSGYGTVSVDTGYGATGTVQEQGVALSASDVVTTVVDFDNNTIAFYVNGTRNGYITGCNFSNWDIWSPGFAIATGGATATTHTTNFGQQPFQYTPVSGAKPWSTAELDAPDIFDPSEHFQTLIGPGPGTGSTTPLGLAYKTTSSADSPTATYQDQVYGKPATELGATTGVHPTFEWAANLSLNGHDDWYLPARYELEILYRNLKPGTASNNTSHGANPNAVPATSNYTSSVPAQTTVAAFQEGGVEAFTRLPTGSYYRSSSEATSLTGAWAQRFNDGGQNPDSKISTDFARAIRRVPYTGSEPSIGASYEGGYFGGLIDAKATPDGTATHALIVAPKEGGEYGVATGILDVAQRTFPNGLWWVKDRANSNQHQLVDSVRGGNLALRCPTTGAETAYVSPSGNSVAWCWSAPDTFTSNAGTIPTSGRRNVDAGFSIATWSGTFVAGSVGHGLEFAPELVIFKNRDQGYNFITHHKAHGATSFQYLDLPAGIGTDSNIVSAAPTNTVVNIGASGQVNHTGNDHVMYCWHSVPGYSRIGAYAGNGNNDGPFVYTGFRTRFLLYKNKASTSEWYIIDTARNIYNPCQTMLYPNLPNAEYTYSAGTDKIDVTANGFKIRYANTGMNAAGVTYIYMAFAENPMGGSGVSPATAR